MFLLWNICFRQTDITQILSYFLKLYSRENFLHQPWQFCTAASGPLVKMCLWKENDLSILYFLVHTMLIARTGLLQVSYLPSVKTFINVGEKWASQMVNYFFFFFFFSSAAIFNLTSSIGSAPNFFFFAFFTFSLMASISIFFSVGATK